MPRVLEKAWGGAREQVGIDHLRLHDLRHLAGTLAASDGAGTRRSCTASATRVQASLIYQHATLARDIALAEAIDDELEDEEDVFSYPLAGNGHGAMSSQRLDTTTIVTSVVTPTDQLRECPLVAPSQRWGKVESPGDPSAPAQAPGNIGC